MKKKLMAAILGAALACGAPLSAQQPTTSNPLLTAFTTPFGLPPFDEITVDNFREAYLVGMEQQRQEIAAIVEQTEAPTFANTIAAMDSSGALLGNVSLIFSGVNGCNTTPQLQALNREMSPLLSAHSDDITMNAALFVRVKAVYDQRNTLPLTPEQAKLLEETYQRFVRNGANLSAADQQKLRELNSRIAMLQLQFKQNLLQETNAYKLIVEDEADLSGLPEQQRAAAAAAAAELGMEGKWVFTLQSASLFPFLQYADNRMLREQMFKAHINKCNHNNEADNKAISRSLLAARLEKAQLMGFDTYAAMTLETRMAKTVDKVYALLNQLWEPALQKAKEELDDIRAEIRKEGNNFEPEGWDWYYYYERARKAKFDIDENEIRPYLELNHVRQGAFFVANKLYGIEFRQLENVPLPHPDAQAFECVDKDGTTLGVLYFDFFPREAKRSGGWCSLYRKVCTDEQGNRTMPIVTIICNFTPPVGNEPALLNADEATTLFHEFGHGLHNLFRHVNYKGVGSVPRDFVELPSQINEHWVFEPEVLKEYAFHYQTGEVIPETLVEKMVESGKYGQGFATVEYLAASYLDMDLHTLTNVPDNMDVMTFEEEVLSGRNLLPQIPSRYRTTYFSHTMGGGYTAGYYSYIWAEVLDCDAFEAFKESGDIFNPILAAKFRDYVLTPGGINDAMDMYIGYRGKEPAIGGLLRNRGLDTLSPIEKREE